MSNIQYLEIAKIINTHGLLGEVKVLCNYYGKNFSKWKPNEIIYLVNNKDYLPLVIKKVRPHKNFLLITFEEHNHINDVSFMKNKPLVIKNDEKSEDNNFSFENLLNYQVYNHADNKLLGIIVELVDNNHTGLWKITNGKKIFYVPNNQFFISKIDKKAKKVYLNLIGGMFNYE